MTGNIEYFGIAAAAGTLPSFKGIIIGGNHSIPSEVREQRGIGSHKALGYRAGLLTPNGSVDFRVQNKTILVKAIRTAGVLSEFGVVCGDTTWGAIHKYCLCKSLALHGAAGEELNATFAWMAKTATESTGANVQSAEVDTVLMWYEFVIATLTGLSIVSFDATLTHRLIQQPVMETGTAGEKRFPKYVLDTGQDPIALNLKLLAQGGADITADALAKIASVSITFTGTQTVVLAFTDLWLAEKNQDFTPGAMASNGLSYLCDDLAIT